MKLQQIIKVIAASTFGLALTSIPVAAKEHEHDHAKHAHKEGHADHMLEGYYAVSTALFKDDLKTAKKAASGMVKHDRKSTLAPAAQQLAKAKNIADARKVFNSLSAAAIKLAKTQKGYKLAFCPMANDSKGGYWLQKNSDTKVNNPYFGAKMPHCGKFKK